MLSAAHKIVPHCTLALALHPHLMDLPFVSESRSGAPWAQRCFVLSATVTPSPRGVEVCECLTVSVNSTGWLVETVLRGSPFSVPVMWITSCTPPGSLFKASITVFPFYWFRKWSLLFLYLSMSTQVTCRLQSWLSVHELLALTSLLLVLDCWSLFYSLRFCSSRNADIYYPRWDLNTHEFVLKTCWISIHVWSRQPFTLMGTDAFYCFCTLCWNAASDQRQSWQDVGFFSKHIWEPFGVLKSLSFPSSLSSFKHLFLYPSAFCVAFVSNITPLK